MRSEWTVGFLVFSFACSGNGDGSANTPSTGKSYCEGALALLELPADPGARGPWQVGARPVSAAGLEAEIWYPAKAGSADGLQRFTYDLRGYLPPEQQASVTESTTILQPCDCYRDIPLDTEHGPFPVILFLHGFSGFRGQSLEQLTHWASRGFVVVSADHPSVGLKTLLVSGIGGLDLGGLGGSGCELTAAGTQTQEAVRMLDELQNPSGDLAFLAGQIDVTRVGVAGHSAGGMALASMSSYPGVKVAIPLAAGGVCQSTSSSSSLIMGGMDDAIVAYSRQTSGFASTPKPKRLVGLSKAAHMAFTSFCPIGKDEGGILQAAMKAGVMFDAAFLALVQPLASDGCGPNNLAPERGWQVINFATAGVLEETLLCAPERASELDRIPTLFPDAVGDYRQELR